MSNTEFRYWAAYFVYKNRLEQEGYERLKQESQDTSEERPTLGRRNY